MRHTRQTIAAAAALVLAAAPAHAAPFYPVPVGATTVAAWSYAGPQVCAEGPDPASTVTNAPWVDVVCLSRIDAWAYRAADGTHFLRATTDLPYVDTYMYIGSLYYDDDTFGAGETDWPFDYEFGTGRDGNLSGSPYPAWLAGEGSKPQRFTASYDYVRYVTDGTGTPENPFPEWSYASFDNNIWLQPVAISAVPEPATVVLVASGVLLVGGIARRRRRA